MIHDEDSVVYIVAHSYSYQCCRRYTTNAASDLLRELLQEPDFKELYEGMHFTAHSGVTGKLRRLLTTTCTTKAMIADFHLIVARLRTAAYLDVLEGLGWKLTSTDNSVIASPSEDHLEFPSFYQHCKGYNDNLGPSPHYWTELLQNLIATETPILKRFLGGLRGID